MCMYDDAMIVVVRSSSSRTTYKATEQLHVTATTQTLLTDDGDGGKSAGVTVVGAQQ